MAELTLKANRDMQDKLEKALMEPCGTLNLTVITEEGKKQRYRIVQLHDIDTEHPEKQRYDLYEDNTQIGADMDFVELSGGIEYSAFMLW